VDKAKDNPDANCFPMGFLQFHQQPQPRKIIQTKQLILIEYEANYGLRHIYLDGARCRSRAIRSRGGTATRWATGKATRWWSRPTTCAAPRTARSTAGST
jgi:hypothetical protein